MSPSRWTPRTWPGSATGSTAMRHSLDDVSDDDLRKGIQ